MIMEKLFNAVCILFGFIGGILINLLGGCDILLNALIVFMVFDYITGVLKGYFQKNIDSKIGFWGIIRKVVILIIVSTAYILGKVIDTSLPLREVVIVFFYPMRA